MLRLLTLPFERLVAADRDTGICRTQDVGVGLNRSRWQVTGGAAEGLDGRTGHDVEEVWLEGLSASQIAKQLGGVTPQRGDRQGPPPWASPGAPRPRSPRAWSSARPSVPGPRFPSRSRAAIRCRGPPAPLPSPVLDLPGTATVLTLGAHMCKWPIGDPSTDDFSFCGRRSGGDGPYCVEHARVAYQPPQKKKSGYQRPRPWALRRYI